MFYNYNRTKIHYRFNSRKKGEVLVLLHGWQGDINSFKALEGLRKRYNTLELSFPPFGKSDEPVNWNVFSYANMVISLCEHLNIKKAHFLGHSFGGRIAILIAIIQKELVDKLILVDSAGVKPRRRISYYLNNIRYKFRKGFGLSIEQFGSSDYKNLSPNMKRVFASIVSTHLEEYASMIKQNTLIVYGNEDKETPIYMAKRLNKLIKNSTLVILEDCSHFCYLEKPYEFCNLADEFVRS